MSCVIFRYVALLRYMLRYVEALFFATLRYEDTCFAMLCTLLRYVTHVVLRCGVLCTVSLRDGNTVALCCTHTTVVLHTMCYAMLRHVALRYAVVCCAVLCFLLHCSARCRAVLRRHERVVLLNMLLSALISRNLCSCCSRATTVMSQPEPG